MANAFAAASQCEQATGCASAIPASNASWYAWWTAMARRKTEVFSLSFLDVIACGFGAVVLFYDPERAGRSPAAAAQR